LDKPFLARTAQLELLRDTYHKVVAREGCDVKFITGQSGTGKTRLINEFLDGIAEPAIVMRAACFSQANLEEAYFAFKALLSSVISSRSKEAQRSDASAKILLKITEELLGKASELASAFIPSWKLIQGISTFALEETGVLEKIKKKITGAAIAPPENLDNNKIAGQIGSFLKASTAVTPVVIVVDDMQWMDNASINRMQKLLTTLTDSRLFFILSFRSNDGNKAEKTASQSIQQLIKDISSSYREPLIDLEHLSETEKQQFSQSFLDYYTPGINQDFVAQFHAASDGLPLYCLELFTLLREKNIVFRDDRQQWQGGIIPFGEMTTAMSSVIADRIVDLDPKYRRWLDKACVQGNVFLTSTILDGERTKEPELLYDLSKVLDKRLKLVEEIPPLYLDGKVVLRYQFSHKLVQQFLYNELSEGEKYYLHKNVAESLECIYGDHIDEQYSIIAYHFNKAMQYEIAYDYYMKACNYQYRIGAYESCVKLLKKLLTKLPYLNEKSEPVKKEVKVLLLLASCYVALYGYGSKELKNINDRAEMISREMNDNELMFHIFWKEWSNLIVQGRLEQSKLVIDKLYSIASNIQSRTVQNVELYHAAGVTDFNSGNFSSATILLRKGLELFEPHFRAEHLHNYGNDPELLITSWLVWSSLFNGQLEESLSLETKLDVAIEQSDHCSSQVFALTFKAMSFVFQSKPNECLECLSGFMHNEKYQMPFWKTWRNVIYKWADCKVNGHYSSPEIDIAKFVRTGGQVWEPYFYALWGDMLEGKDVKLADKIFKLAIKKGCVRTPRFHTLPILAAAYQFSRTKDSDFASKLAERAKNTIQVQQANYWKAFFNNEVQEIS
jgi:tetratricopeptide (TPR) repeat protein